MPYSYKAVCYTQIADAQKAACQSMTMNTITGSGELAYSSCTSFTSSGMQVLLTVGKKTTSSTESMPTFQPCTYDGGVSLIGDYFALGLGVLAIVWAAKRVVSLFTGRIDVV
jgi:hypothetical protein